MTPSSQTVAGLLREARRLLANHGIASPGLDAEILLRDTLQTSREDLYVRMADSVPGTLVNEFQDRVRRRAKGVPVAYITGVREFYGREFSVSPSVLVPRPETELLVERAINWLRQRAGSRCTVVDVGTGSGAIGVSIAAETSEDCVILASDVSLDALKVAGRNRDCYAPSVDLIAGSMLDWCRGTVDLIAANLPYLRPDQAHDGIRHEPEVALFAGDDGFALNGELIRQSKALLARPGLLIMEIDPDQAGMTLNVATEAFPDESVRVEADLASLDRLLIIERA